MFQNTFGPNASNTGNQHSSSNITPSGSNWTQNNGVLVEITGWTNADEKDLSSFIHRKTKVNIKIIHADRITGILKASVKTDGDANTLSKCNGIRFAGNILRIKILSYSSTTSAAGGNSTVALIKSALSSRYDSTSRLLNLDGIRNDVNTELRGVLSNSQTASKFFLAMLKIALQEHYEIESLNLSNNNLGNNSRELTEMAVSLPGLKNLALSNNNITKLDALEKLKNKLPHLRELWITGNPVDNPTATGDIIKTFPRLIILNGLPVRDENKLTKLLSFPIPNQSLFFESSDLQRVAIQFTTTYLRLWDHDRISLISLFSPESQFSYHFDTTHIVDTPIGSVDSKATRVPQSVASSWGSYISNSRNLMRVSGLRPRMSKVFRGGEQITQAFRSLPGTKHDLEENPQNYSIEVVSVPILNAMQISIHGGFKEVSLPVATGKDSNSRQGSRFGASTANSRSTLEMRSFDRSLMVIAGPNGSYIVASDMLLLKPFSGSGAWYPKVPFDSLQSFSTPSNGQTTTNAIEAISIPSDIAANLNISQQQLLCKVMTETNLVLQYSLLLCEQSNWDYGTALMNFQNSRSQIPSEAFHS
ncbi:hypothetical protein KL928_004477 [Ogataea angusta]|uniref:mRNA export factor MEX67 n=1 Tax=Pichia angusta TaxID=870730 RepID=A0AAN6I491_PICAN|nr:uncharacterized protein KL928_004477 [Ogataea angusta]KAG7816435.1 hypothetical protein KL928_004477 [Ogataea angusta]KAG7833113.1 hypothetical protein KL943_004561 [Ogataea angusta]